MLIKRVKLYRYVPVQNWNEERGVGTFKVFIGEMSAKYVLDFVGSEGSAHRQVPLRDEAR